MSPIDHDCTPQERNVLLDRIAELEDELEHQTEARKHHAKLEREAVMAAGKAIKRAEQAAAELAALEGRRCETCASGESQGDIIQLVLCHAVERFSNTNTLVAPFTHSCSWWTARAEEGSEK